MQRLAHLLFTSLVVVSAAACGKLPGGVSIPRAGGADEAASAATASGASAAEASAEAGAEAASDAARPVRPELVAYYQKLDFRGLYPLLHEGPSEGSFDKASADVGRDVLWQSGNPDPAWIKTWKTADNSYVRANAAALIQAAFNRSWEAACKAEFDTSHAAHRKLATELGTALAKLDGQRGYYARMAGYVALADKFEQGATAAGLDARKDPFGPSGFRVTILQHAVAFHRASPAAYTDFPWSRFGANAERVRKDGRELGADPAFERQAYCAVAARAGGATVTPFADKGSGAVDPSVWGDREAVLAKVESMIEASRKALEVDGGIRIPTIEATGGLTFHEREPKLALMEDATVDAVRRDGDGASVTVTRKKVESYTYACKPTSTVESVGDDGRVKYKEICKSGDKIYALTARVAFADLPPGLALAKGDVVSFSADVVEDDSKKVTDTAAKVEWARTMELTGRLLVAAKRGSKSLL